MKNQRTKNTLLQVAQANTQTKTCKRVFFSPTREKLKNKKFPSLQKNKTLQPHSPRQTDTNLYDGQFTTKYLWTLDGDTDDNSTGGNKGLKEMAGDEQIESFLLSISFAAWGQ